MKHFSRLFCAALASLLLILDCGAQNIIYVSNKARKSGDGSFHKPFGSLKEALKKCEGAQGSTTIYLRGGVHYLSEPIVVTPAMGNERHSLTISSFPGEKAIISGGTALKTDWREYKGGIMKTKISGVSQIDMLFGDGGMLLTMARYPNYDLKAIRFHGTSAPARFSRSPRGRAPSPRSHPSTSGPSPGSRSSGATSSPRCCSSAR